MLLVAMKCFRCGWFIIPNSRIEMEPEYCDSIIGAGISAAGSRGSHSEEHSWMCSPSEGGGTPPAYGAPTYNQEAKGGHFITFSFHQRSEEKKLEGNEDKLSD